MGITRSVSRNLTAVIGLIALTVVAAVPAESHGTREVAAEPIVGPELPVANPLVDTPREGNGPAVAFGGSVHLTAWWDFVRGIVVARVDRAGTVIDPFGISLTDGEPGQSPVVAFDGTNFLVAWAGAGGIVARRVSPDGSVLDDENIQVSSGPGVGRGPAIAFDGTNSFLIWSSEVEGTGSDIFGAHVSPAGLVLEPADLPVVTSPGFERSFGLAFNGTHHLVVWDTFDLPDSNVHGTLVDTSGTALNPSGLPISTAVGDQTAPAVEAVGTDFLVAWRDTRSGSPVASDVYGSRIDATGSVLDPSGIAIAATSADETSPTVTSDGVNALVLFSSSGGGNLGTRVDATGTVLDPSGVAVPLAAGSDQAFDGDNFYLVASDPTVRGARVTRDLAVLDPVGITISVGANSQFGITTAFDGTNTLVVWSDDRPQGEGPGLYGGRVGPDGRILDGAGFLIESGPAVANAPNTPSVAFDGTNFLVTWLDGQHSGIGAATVSRDGAVVDRFDVLPPGGEVSWQAVAFGGGGFLVAWQSIYESTGGGSRHEVRAGRVGADGTVLDPSGFLIDSFTTSTRTGTIDVAYGGTGFMVVWDLGSDGHAIRGARVEIPDAGPVPAPEPFSVASDQRELSAAQIAWNGGTHLVVWTAAAGEGADSLDVHGARVDDAGAVLDPTGLPISTAPGDQQAPTVSANGPFLVAWIDRRRGVATDPDLYATRVDADGTVGHPEGFAVSTSIGEGFFGTGSAVTPAPGAGEFSVWYQRFVRHEPFWTTRAFLRHVSPK